MLGTVPGRRSGRTCLPGNPRRTDPARARAVARAPEDCEAHRLLLVYLQAQGKDAEAREVSSRLRRLQAEQARGPELLLEVKQNPHDPAPRYQLGLLLLRSGREEQGVRLLLAALTEDPRHQPSHVALAEYYEHAGRPDLAAQHRAAP